MLQGSPAAELLVVARKASALMPRSTEVIALPTMTPGTGRNLTVHRFGKKAVRPKVYIHAALHADELPATMVVHHLMPMLETAEAEGRIRGEIIVVPVANPIGLNQNLGSYFSGRFDLSTRENYNRNFPADWAVVADAVRDRLTEDAEANVALIRDAACAYVAEQKPASELDALRWKLLELSIDADYVLDLHCAATALVYLMIYKDCLDIGARDLSADIGSRASFLIDWYADKRTFMTTTASLWSRVREAAPDFAVPQGLMSCVVEYRGRLDVSDVFGRPDAENLLRFLKRRGVVEGPFDPPPQALCTPVPVSHMVLVTAPAGGVVAYNKMLGEPIKAGDVVCEIINPLEPDPARARTPVPAPIDGIVFDMRNDHLARPGSVVYRMCSDQPQDRRADQAPQDD